MAKQIYIDSNGNEVLVSGTITNDNNLPHYTGTPTAGTTAYEIASKAEIIKDNASGNTGGFGYIEATLPNANCILCAVDVSNAWVDGWTRVSGSTWAVSFANYQGAKLNNTALSFYYYYINL